MSAWEHNPGSPDAKERGCICAVFDNNHGKGMTAGYGTPEVPAFWITGGCPLHAPEEDECS